MAPTAGAPYAFLAATPGNGIRLQYDFTGDQLGPATAELPVWLRLTRTGAVLTAATSTDGSTWTTLGSTTLSFTGPAEVGLAVTSHNGGAHSTATFDNLTVTGAP